MGKAIEMTSTLNVLSAPLLEVTSVLAEHLMQSEPFVHFHEADRKLHENQEAMGLLTEAADLQQRVRGQRKSSDISESDIQRLRELQDIINANETIQEQHKARELAVAFLREINQEISGLLGIDFASLTRRPSKCC